jgi:hypothetical protein
MSQDFVGCIDAPFATFAAKCSSAVSTKVGCVLRTATHLATTDKVNCESHFGTHSLKLRGCTALRSTVPSAPYTSVANLLAICKPQGRQRWSRVQHEVHQCTLRLLGREP